MYKKMLLIISLCLVSVFICSCDKKDDDVLTLRICNWEEYIDEGDWDEEETIDLPSGDIIGENSMIEDFEEWYEDTYGEKIKVEYSCFGTNEELYNQLTLGDEFDLVCPSEYMIMKLLNEDKLVKYDDSFYDASDDSNYYAKGVSPYISNYVKDIKVENVSIADYIAGYMWGVTGSVYNPEEVSEEDASTWKLMINPKYKRKVTMKDNVRDAYFASLGMLKSDELVKLFDDYKSGKITFDEYHKILNQEMNDEDPKTIQAVENLLQDNKDMFYSFETDNGKSDIVTGKIVTNYQWSGDGVFALDQAEEDGVYLNFAVPKECTNLWFDGWVMLKDGIGGDDRRKIAAERFVNFISRPDNVVRNMYYIGYTSAIAGGDDSTIFDYADWCYGAEDDEEDVVDYPLDYFFSGDSEGDEYVITAPREQLKRQLFAQYPTVDVLERSSIMEYCGGETTSELNQMWINVRCFNPFRK